MRLVNGPGASFRQAASPACKGDKFISADVAVQILQYPLTCTQKDSTAVLQPILCKPERTACTGWLEFFACDQTQVCGNSGLQLQTVSRAGQDKYTE